MAASGGRSLLGGVVAVAGSGSKCACLSLAVGTREWPLELALVLGLACC